MKPVMLLLGALVIILLLPSTVPSIQDFRSESFTEAQGSITTAAGITSANVTLTQDLFDDATSEIVSITSSDATDIPLATTYTAASNKLLVIGLNDDASRTLTIVYKIGTLTDFWGVDLASRTLLTFIILGVIGVVAAAVYQGTRRE